MVLRVSLLKWAQLIAVCVFFASLCQKTLGQKNVKFQYGGRSWYYNSTLTFPTISMAGGSNGMQGQCQQPDLVRAGIYVSRITLWRRSKRRMLSDAAGTAEGAANQLGSRNNGGSLRGIEIGWGHPGKDPIAKCHAGVRDGDSYSFAFEKDEGIKSLVMKHHTGVDLIQWTTDHDRTGGFGHEHVGDSDVVVDMGGGFITGMLFSAGTGAFMETVLDLESLAFLVLDTPSAVQYRNWMYSDWDKLPAGQKTLADGGKVWQRDNLKSSTAFRMNIQVHSMEGFTYNVNKVTSATVRQSWAMTVEGGFQIPLLSATKANGSGGRSWDSVTQDSFTWVCNKMRSETVTVEFVCPPNKYCRQTFFNYRGNAHLQWVADVHISFTHSDTETVFPQASGTFDGLSYTLMDSVGEEFDHVPEDAAPPAGDGGDKKSSAFEVVVL